jgi:ubiquinone/menaquinone biosynthesis C-methylase UbiE
VKQYYEARAREYDDWWLGEGVYALRDRPGFDDEVQRVLTLVRGLYPARVLDVACGTGFLTRQLRGEVTAFDQSQAMLDIAGDRMPHARLVQGDAMSMPFADGEFDRLFTSHFYGHLPPEDRELFIAEARRVAGEVVLVDSAVRPDHEPEEWQTRRLRDGSSYEIFKRYFRPELLIEEWGGEGAVLHAGEWFVAVRV